jgi:HK97 family phage major capsid protein
MIDIKATREQMQKIHAEASAHTEKYATADAVAPTAEETAAQEARFAQLDKMNKAIEEQEKLARFSFTKEQPVKATAVEPAKQAAQHFEPAALPQATKETYAKELSSWARSDEPETYATISVSGNAAIVPQIVVNPITPTKYNCYRAAYTALGLKPESFGNTAPAVVPVITSSSGGLIPEGVQNSSNDAAPAVATLTLTAHGYQSQTYWYSNELINAESFDVTSSTLPALQGAREYGFAKAISTAIIADATLATVSTATHSTLIIDNLDALIHAFSLLYDQNKVIFLNMDTYAAAETLKDSNGRPIFEFQTIQDQSFTSYKGVPVYKHDSFQALTTAGNVVGCAVSLTGFRLRDEQEKLIKYVDSPTFVDQTGLNNVRYQGWGYVNGSTGAVVKLIAGT